MKHQKELVGIAAAVAVTAFVPLVVLGLRRGRCRDYRHTPEFRAIAGDYLI